MPATYPYDPTAPSPGCQPTQKKLSAAMATVLTATSPTHDVPDPSATTTKQRHQHNTSEPVEPQVRRHVADFQTTLRKPLPAGPPCTALKYSKAGTQRRTEVTAIFHPSRADGENHQHCR